MTPFDKTQSEMRGEVLRTKIIQLAREYGETYPLAPPDKISFGGRIRDGEEMEYLADSILEFFLTAKTYCDRFERELAGFLGLKHCLFVNSGSSANLLAFMTLTSPLLGERQIKRGDEVITVAAGFPTTVTPMLQYGAVPVFVDVTIPQYNIDVSKLEEARSPKTKAVMLAHTLGNPFDIVAVKAFCDKYGLWLIEDNCDALGSRVIVEKQGRYTGTVGDIGTSSFYPAHHMTTGEGGAVYTNNKQLHDIALSFRDWGRDCICSSGRDGVCGRRYDRDYGDYEAGHLPKGYDHKYTYSHFGYNLKATEMQAAIGCAQLHKLTDFIRLRRRNFDLLKSLLQDTEDKLILPEPLLGSRPSWFGFLITCRDGIDRNAFVQHLEAGGVQTRLLFAGNMTRQPCFDSIRNDGKSYRVVGELTETDRIMNQAFWVGVHPILTKEKVETLADTIKSFFER